MGDYHYEYNELTKQLLAAGYSVENYPDYVQIDRSRLPGDDPLRNLSGGFEYKRWYRDELVYRTGCGKFVMGKNVIEMGMNISWSHENNNPVIRCPYNKAQCPDNDPRLHGERGGGLCVQCFCVCHRTDKKYDYENSIEKADAEREAEIERKYREYVALHNGRVCRNHMSYNERTEEWNQHYEPRRCANICYSQDGYCPILGRQLSRKKGNVYYDIMTSYIPQNQDKQISIFEIKKEKVTSIKKGVRFFDRPVSIDICEAFIKVQADYIAWNYRINNSYKEFFNPTWEFEILNVRAESKPSRDLLQDLEDIKAGIYISFEPEDEKRDKAAKKLKRIQNKQKKIERLEKKILEVGYWNMEPHSLDRVHADAWLGSLRIDELEEMRQQRLKEEQDKPVQISLFDIMQKRGG